MPIYDYHCDHCGHAFSAVQRFADDAISVCPSCGKPPRRLLSNPALVFKGSGWYKTDSRGPEKKESSTTGTAAAKDTTSSPDVSTKTAEAATTAPAAGPSSAATTGDAAPAPAKKPEKAERASS